MTQSPNLNLTELQWWDCKRAAHKQLPANLSEVKERLAPPQQHQPENCQRAVK